MEEVAAVSPEAAPPQHVLDLILLASQGKSQGIKAASKDQGLDIAHCNPITKVDKDILFFRKTAAASIQDLTCQRTTQR